jgi:hypothetical protein
MLCVAEGDQVALGRPVAELAVQVMEIEGRTELKYLAPAAEPRLRRFVEARPEVEQLLVQPLVRQGLILKRVRPQVLAAITLLAGLGTIAMFLGYEPIAGVCATGIVGLGNRILESQDKPNAEAPRKEA